MTVYRVFLETEASSVIDVEVPDELEGLEAEDAAVDAAFEIAPDVCGHCSGWGQLAGIELGEWKLDEAERVDP